MTERVLCLFPTLLFVSLICFAKSSSVPNGLDPTVQVFQATPSATDPAKPKDLTDIHSAQAAHKLMALLKLKLISDPDLCRDKQAIVVHTADWLVTPPKALSGDYAFSLKTSQWTGFIARYKNKNCALSAPLRVDKNPLFYGAESIYVVGINYFADENGNGIDPNLIQVGYKVSTTASKPQNVQDLGTLVAALVGFTLPTVGTQSVDFVGGPNTSVTAKPHFFVLEQSVAATSPAPFTINVTPVIQPATSTLPPAIAQQGYSLDLAGRAGRGNSILDVKNLPEGMNFDETTKVLSGTPQTTGNQPIQVEIKDASGTHDFLMNLPVQPANSPNAGAPSKKDSTKQGQGNQTSITSPSQPVDCGNVSSTNPCTFTRNFPVDDKEYWDVSLGLAIPGPKENVFKPTTGGGVPPSSTTTHTDAYAFADFYPFAYRWTKQSYAPHVNGGIPITSQSLHRPYVGLAEDISPWLQRHGFPLDLCVFGGVVFMKQQLYDPSVPSRLRTDWARKAMYGVEVPISGIASKLSGKGNKGSNTKSGGS